VNDRLMFIASFGSNISSNHFESKSKVVEHIKIYQSLKFGNFK
jgi:hypothetical protein